MSKDHEDDRGRRSGKPPEKPAPHLPPHGPLLAMGNALDRTFQPPSVPQSNREQATLATSLAPLSPQDKIAEQKRPEERHLQAQGLVARERQFAPKLQRRREEFDKQHQQEIYVLQSECRTIQDRHAEGTLRGKWNRLTGRLAQDEDRLRQLNQQQTQLDARRDEYLAPLLNEHQQELAIDAADNEARMDDIEHEIQRDVYGIQSHDQSEPDDHGADRADDHSGRKR